MRSDDMLNSLSIRMGRSGSSCLFVRGVFDVLRKSQCVLLHNFLWRRAASKADHNVTTLHVLPNCSSRRTQTHTETCFSVAREIFPTP